ncbi:MAG: tRNA pseudouridine(55) synthase TruB [Actinomycetota bacterium]|nr:tRNA pseudouridine(55) synthase TruB [Actinomycetota bacterium]
MKYNDKSDFYLLDKPKSWTSQDLCTKLKKNFYFKKVGHSGTLDPNATGLMLLATNGYTKLFDYINQNNKTYEATALLGYSSSTLDIDGDVRMIENINALSLETEINTYFQENLGEIQQTPPKYSAIKVDGKRLYKYARKNQKVDIPVRKVMIHDSKIIKISENRIVFNITVSKGTFIRSFVEDLGRYLNTSAILENLTRTKIGSLDLKHKNLIKNVQDLNYQSKISPLNWIEVLNMPSITLDIKFYDLIKNGNLISKEYFGENKETIITINNEIIAIYEPFKDNKYKPTKVII